MRKDSAERDSLKLVYTGVLKGSIIQAIGIHRFLRKGRSSRPLDRLAENVV